MTTPWARSVVATLPKALQATPARVSTPAQGLTHRRRWHHAHWTGDEPRRYVRGRNGTEHLLLGLLGQPDSPGARMLEELGAAPEKVRPALELLMRGGPGSGAAPPNRGGP